MTELEQHILIEQNTFALNRFNADFQEYLIIIFVPGQLFTVKRTAHGESLAKGGNQWKTLCDDDKKNPECQKKTYYSPLQQIDRRIINRTPFLYLGEMVLTKTIRRVGYQLHTDTF